MKVRLSSSWTVRNPPPASHDISSFTSPGSWASIYITVNVFFYSTFDQRVLCLGGGKAVGPDAAVETTFAFPVVFIFYLGRRSPQKVRSINTRKQKQRPSETCTWTFLMFCRCTHVHVRKQVKYKCNAKRSLLLSGLISIDCGETRWFHQLKYFVKQLTGKRLACKRTLSFSVLVTKMMAMIYKFHCIRSSVWPLLTLNDGRDSWIRL